MESLDDIIAAAQSLPSSDRARLIALLWDGMAPEDWDRPSEEWIREANRRSAEIDAGTLQTDSWENVRQRARRRAGLV
ncbi:addiction module protein [Candidatus Laterigemmans baculatus]|uniref:addiction module protein n=1 Tax=Candidatus Laterigemmans baculatus TaxID=2770505 RepID=UPI0013DD05F2|nr:addiction module protein [Candidatus Laterigemmans baculatus]